MKVEVLLSTYNGMPYIGPLLESLAAQDYPDVNILIRDDGSSDGTVDLLREFAASRSNIRFIPGEHVGFMESFFKLLEISSPDADYFAFCDQDDIWLPDKISQAASFLRREPQDTAALYCSRLSVVDEDLKPLGHTPVPGKALSFRNALVEGQVPGCTAMINRAARLILLRELPRYAYSHDWWMYLVVSAFGTVVYDREPRILYRMHAGNVFGMPTGSFGTWRTKLTLFLKERDSHPLVRQAEEFRRIFGLTLPEEKKRTLDRFIGSVDRFRDRLVYAMTCDVYRQNLRDEILLRMRIVFNRL
jgi:glycosyltransferase involved in cell wall biosynthesis